MPDGPDVRIIGLSSRRVLEHQVHRTSHGPKRDVKLLLGLRYACVDVRSVTTESLRKEARRADLKLMIAAALFASAGVLTLIGARSAEDAGLAQLGAAQERWAETTDRR